MSAGMMLTGETKREVILTRLHQTDLLQVLAPVVSEGGFSMKGYWIWCPSVMRAEDGRYVMVASRWPKTIPFHPGWLTNSEIVLATSDCLEGPYQYRQTLFPSRGAQYWDGRATHNPRLIKWGKYYVIFYVGMTHALHDVGPGQLLAMSDPRVIQARASKRVGVAIAENIYGPWKRFDAPILLTKPNTFYSFLTSNPAPCVAPDGSILLVFKSRAYEGDVHGPMHLGVAKAKDILGPYTVVGKIELKGEVEDPFIWHNGSNFELIAKDMTGLLCGEKHAGVQFLSNDGVLWDLAKNPKAYSLRLQWNDGSMRKTGCMERPFLYIEDNCPKALFTATGDGPGDFAHALNTWNSVIPIKSNF